MNGTSAMIVETEAYCGEEDKACHTFEGRKTDRTSVLYYPGGTAYIYQIYGLYFCLNAVTGEKGVGEMDKEGRGRYQGLRCFLSSF